LHTWGGFFQKYAGFLEGRVEIGKQGLVEEV